MEEAPARPLAGTTYRPSVESLTGSGDNQGADVLSRTARISELDVPIRGSTFFHYNPSFLNSTLSSFFRHENPGPLVIRLIPRSVSHLLILVVTY
jgi:hypothetical protein